MAVIANFFNLVTGIWWCYMLTTVVAALAVYLVLVLLVLVVCGGVGFCALPLPCHAAQLQCKIISLNDLFTLFGINELTPT